MVLQRKRAILVSLAVVLASVLASCRVRRESDAGSKPLEAVTDDSGSFDPDDAERIAALFRRITDQRHPLPTTEGEACTDSNPEARSCVKRPVFLKPHGCARATFTVPEDLDVALRVGLFAMPGRYDAWVRSSSDTVPTTVDQGGSTIGLGIKVLGVPGLKVLPGEEGATTQDFLTQNHPVFFVDTAKDFLDFTESIFDGTFQAYRTAHPETARILDAMRKDVQNVLGATYWSTVPSRFGAKDYAKYLVTPCAPLANEPSPPAALPGEDLAETEAKRNYLRHRLVRDVAEHGGCFDLAVQRRGDAGDAMPLDRATVPWSSPPEKVARVEIMRQDILPLDGDCENMSFTAWHALEAHRPVGSVQKARGMIYKFFADLRRSRNGKPAVEPE